MSLSKKFFFPVQRPSPYSPPYTDHHHYHHHHTLPVQSQRQHQRQPSPSPHRLMCGVLTPNHAGTTNDSGDWMATPGMQIARPSDSQGPKQRSRAAAPMSNSCSTIIRDVCSRSERVRTARAYPTVPSARKFFNHPGVKDSRMLCRCVTTGESLRFCSFPRLFSPLLPVSFASYFMISTHSTPIDFIIHSYASFICHVVDS